MVDDFWERRNEFMKDHTIHMISFSDPKSTGYSCLCLGQGQRPEKWHIEKLKELIVDFEDGKFEPNKEADDYSDLC